MRTLALLFALTLSCLAQPLSPNDPAFLQSTSPLRRGLVGYWRLEEASGTRYDCSSTGAHLTDNNSVGQNTGKQGYCGNFAASSSQYLTASNTNQLQFGTNNAFTIVCFAKLTNSPLANKFQVLAMKYDTSVDIGWLFAVQDQGHLNFYAGSDATHYIQIQGLTPSCTNEAWNCCAASYSGNGSNTGLTLYVNNTAYTAARSGTLNGNILNAGYFAISSNSGSVFANGLIDELGIWNRVLTTAELTQIYNVGAATHFPWAHP